MGVYTLLRGLRIIPSAVEVDEIDEWVAGDSEPHLDPEFIVHLGPTTFTFTRRRATTWPTVDHRLVTEFESCEEWKRIAIGVYQKATGDMELPLEWLDDLTTLSEMARHCGMTKPELRKRLDAAGGNAERRFRDDD